MLFEKSFKIYVLNSHQVEIFSLCHNSTFKFLALMEAKSSVMFSNCYFVYVLSLFNWAKAIVYKLQLSSVQLLSRVLTLCDPMDCSTPGLPVYHQLPEFIQTHANWVSDAFQASHALLYPPPPTFNLSQHQGLFKWVSSSYWLAKVLEFQLQHQSFQWIVRTDFF